LFPVSGRVPGGIDRKKHKMMQLDMEAARTKWIENGKTATEKRRRRKSDFLAYKNEAGLFADFHSFRDLFITSLERAGIKPRMAQTLARHSDIRLTPRVGGVLHSRNRVEPPTRSCLLWLPGESQVDRFRQPPACQTPVISAPISLRIASRAEAPRGLSRRKVPGKLPRSMLGLAEGMAFVVAPCSDIALAGPSIQTVPVCLPDPAALKSVIRAAATTA
jgi:hypothetical protein